MSLGEGLDLHQQPAVALAGHRQAGIAHKFRLAMMTGGVDLSGSPGGVTSATHGAAELNDTVKSSRNTVRMLKEVGEIEPGCAKRDDHRADRMRPLRPSRSI